jgi:hypothetical protein
VLRGIKIHTQGSGHETSIMVRRSTKGTDVNLCSPFSAFASLRNDCEDEECKMCFNCFVIMNACAECVKSDY